MAGEGGEEMIAMMKRWAMAHVRGKENKGKPVMKIIINAGYDTRVARAFIDEMNKAYGESHTLYVEVTC